MKKIFTYTLILISILAGSSCNDWLDVKPKAQVESDKLFQQKKGFEDALTACYIKLKSTNLYGRNLTMTTVEYLAQHWDYSSGSDKDEDKLKGFLYDTEYCEGIFKAIYGEMYNTIVQANSVLENIQTHGQVIQEEALRKMIEAEALGIRAFCHTDILRLFGQIPGEATIQVSLPYAKNVTNEAIPYYSFKDYVNLILSDIEAAQLLLKDSDPVMTYTFEALDNYTDKKYNVDLEDNFMGYRRFRFNYYALEALKARLYLYINDKKNALIAANNVITAQSKTGEKMLTLSGDNDLKSNYYALPSECILALNNNDIQKDCEYLFSYDANYVKTTNFKDLFDGQATDVNNRALYVWPKVTSNGTTYYNLRKYQQPEANQVSNANLLNTRYQVIPLIRLSEMYLIAMESTPLFSEANKLYIEYMAARSISSPGIAEDKLSAEIINEYRRELWGEGQMFYTYKRLGTKKMLWKIDREITEKDYIVPLPSTELDTNK